MKHLINVQLDENTRVLKLEVTIGNATFRSKIKGLTQDQAMDYFVELVNKEFNNDPYLGISYFYPEGKEIVLSL